MLLVRVADRVELAVGIGDFEQQHHVGIAHETAPRVVLAERMPVREVHARAEVDHRRADGLREGDEVLDALLAAHGAIGEDHGRLCSDEHARRLRERTRIAHRESRRHELRDRELVRVLDRALLQLHVGHEQHGFHRRRRGHAIRAHGRFGEVLQRAGLVVPLHEIAHERRGILHRVIPLRAGSALGGVDAGARDDEDRNAIAPRVVQTHRGMLQAHGAMRHDHHRLAGGLRVAVRDRHRRLLVQARQELGLAIAAVVDDGFVQAAKARAGIGRDVLEIERLDDVDHEVGTGAADDDVARQGLFLPFLPVRRAACGVRGGLLGRSCRRRHARRRNACAGGCRRLEEAAPVEPVAVDRVVTHDDSSRVQRGTSSSLGTTVADNRGSQFRSSISRAGRQALIDTRYAWMSRSSSSVV